MNDTNLTLLSRNLRSVRDRIDAAARSSGRVGADVTCVAVTKSVDTDVTGLLLQLGHADFGENRVQELERKALTTVTMAGAKPHWHLIGPLQANKVRKAFEHAHLLHALDEPSLWPRMDRIAGELGKTARGLVEVNLSGEGSKHGVTADAVLAFLRDAKRFSHLEMHGLMTMAPAQATGPQLTTIFATLRILRDEAAAQRLFAPTARFGGELSMGMSGDFEIAVEEGATLVRIGTALFADLEQKARSEIKGGA